jgi:hypothetical protein
MPTQNTSTDYCTNFKQSASKAITYTDKVLQTVDCYFKQLRNVLKVLKSFLFLALQVLWSLSPNFYVIPVRRKLRRVYVVYISLFYINQALVLRPNCVPKIMGANKKCINKNKIPIRNNEIGRG